jgi:peptidoglycan/LPS O-acetylase OafA/YrhL
MINFKKKYLFDISEISRVSYRGDVTTLRAIAVIAVVLYHAEIKFFDGGWLGVDIFFVISGYLISNIIISELNENSFTFRNFYFRRFKRIYPSLIFTILLTSVGSYFIIKPTLIVEFLRSIFSSILFYSNVYFNSVDFYISGSSKLKPLLHTWSLAVEEQIYIVVPIIFYIVFKINKKLLLYTVLTLTIYSVFLNSTVVGFEKFYLSQYRLWEFLLGTLVMLMGSKLKIKRLDFICFVLLFIAFYYFDESYILQLEPKLIVNFLTCTLLLNSNSNNIFNKIHNIKIVERIGISSYSIYLIHQPVFALIENYNLKQQIKFNNLFIVLFVIIFSIFFSKYIEFPFLKNLTKFKLYVLLFITVLCTLYAYFGIENSGYQERYQSYEQIFSIGSNREELLMRNTNNLECGGLNNRFCEFDTNNDKTIVLVADSTGEFLAPYLYDEIKHDFNFIPLIGDEFYRCTFYSEEIKEIRGSGDCSGSEQLEFNDFVTTNSELIYVFFASYQRFNEGWLNLDNKYNYYFDLILQENKLLFITPVPFVLEEKHIINDLYLNFRFNFGDTIGYSSNIWNPVRNSINRQIENFNQDIKILDYTDIFCEDIFSNTCVNAYDNKIFYFDNVHLSRAGTKYLVNSMINDAEFLKFIFE